MLIFQIGWYMNGSFHIVMFTDVRENDMFINTLKDAAICLNLPFEKLQIRKETFQVGPLAEHFAKVTAE